MFRQLLLNTRNVAATTLTTRAAFANYAKMPPAELPKPSRPSPSYEEIVAARHKYLAPSLKTFEAYDKPLVLKSAWMQYMWDIQGNRYIDLLGQNLCISVGHRHPEVTKAAVEQMNTLPHCTTMYYHEHSAMYAKDLIDRLPKHPSGDDWVVHLVCTGSEAVDLAIQMARVYTGRPEVVGLQKAYHGLQGYAAGLTHNPKAEQTAYKTMFNGLTHLASNDLDGYQTYLKNTPTGKIAAFIAEPLQGFGGIFPLQNGYLKNAFEMTRKHGGICIADEVQTGFCRTGEAFWGFQTPNNQAIPDMITIAKGMGNGIGIMGGVITTRTIANAFATKMWFNTFGSNPVASAVARAVLRVIDDDGILKNCKAQGDLFRSRLQKACEKYPQALKEIRGSGLFQGLEIAGKTQEQSQANSYEMHRRLLKHGVVVGRGSSAGNVFRIQPPMCIQKEDVEHVCNSIESVAQEFIKEKGL